MQTAYNVNREIAVEGQPHGEPRMTRPYELPFLEQIDSGTIAASESGTWTLTITDDETGQVHTLAVTVSGAVEATTLNELVAAWQADGKFNDLATITEDGVDTYTVTYRHANRSYTLVSTPPGSMTDVVTTTQEPGGANIRYGRLVAKGPGEREFQALQTTSTLADIAGFLFRPETGPLHELDDAVDAVDDARRGKTFSVAEDGSFWVLAEEAVAFTDEVHVRRAPTSGTGTVGAFRASPAGAAEVWTVTPTTGDETYALRIAYDGEEYLAVVGDAAALTATQICDGLRDSLPTVAGLTFGGTATLTITTAVGTELDEDPHDVEGTLGIVETTAADVDTIDVSSICEYVRGAAAGGLALVKLKGLV